MPDGGTPIEVELWELAPAALGELMCGIPRPLGIGRVELDDGGEVLGFVCEAYVAATSLDITDYGGWRSYLAARS